MKQFSATICTLNTPCYCILSQGTLDMQLCNLSIVFPRRSSETRQGCTYLQICKRQTCIDRDHSQFACCNQTVTTINKWWRTPLSSLVFMGLCVCARILNHNMVKYTLQLCTSYGTNAGVVSKDSASTYRAHHGIENIIFFHNFLSKSCD